MNIGDRVLTYIIEQELGQGGMGTVYLGRHTVLNQQVAIKSLLPLLSRNQALRERFILEANIQAGLHHPGIVRVLTADMEGEQPSLVMEYIEGKSLAEVLKLRGALPIEDAVKIMKQVLSAVGYAHKQGVVHRDLKPSNVMVMATGEAKVTDFGIAKVLGLSTLTGTGTEMGSPHYMSPEQIRRPETVDERSDIYSIGCVFYEVLAGHPPFGEKDTSSTVSDFEIKEKHVHGQIPPLQSISQGIPDWLAQLVMSMLEKIPEKRPSRCELILEGIKAGGNDEKSGVAEAIGDSEWEPSDDEQQKDDFLKQKSALPKDKERSNSFLKKTLISVFVVVFVISIIFVSQHQANNEKDFFISEDKPVEETITQQAEKLVLKIGAGNPNNLAPCKEIYDKRFDNCWGKQKESDGESYYLGEFRNGNKHGLGTYTWGDGEKYIGEWSYGKRNGKAIQTKVNGEKYVGEYRNGFFHGQGIKYASNGSVIESGIYENGKLVKSGEINR